LLQIPGNDERELILGTFWVTYTLYKCKQGLANGNVSVFPLKNSEHRDIIPKAVYKNYGAEWAEKSSLHASIDISQ